jgi:ketosteroid isomerase-like protein
MLVTTFSSFAQSGNEASAVNRSKELKAISNLLEQYITANENEDLGLIESIWAPDADIILIGTTKNSRQMGWNNIRNAYKKQYEDLDNIYITASEQYVKLNKSGNTAWFAETLEYNYMKDGKAKNVSGLRFTGVLEKCPDGKWRFVQAHLSIPVESD